jgi:hypothetical protein
LQSILTHEAGHFMGLAHATDTNSIMYAFYQEGAIELTPDDQAGICNIYPPAPRKSGCASAAGAAPDDLWSVGVVLVVAVVAWKRRRAGPHRGSAPPGS